MRSARIVRGLLRVGLLILVAATARVHASDSSPLQSEAATHLGISAARFTKPDGSQFEWRGISAFRLVEMFAHGKRAEATAYLDWAAEQQLTVVRVLTMATHLFQLSPEDGVKALPEVLETAAQRGIHVEIVALADTADMTMDFEAHVKAVGAIAGRHANALVEIANEPGHQTQSLLLHDPAYVQRLARLIPEAVPVALGSIEYGDGYSGGDYITWHAPRGRDHIHTLQRGVELLRRFGKPVVSDEPIGAAETAEDGRRDDSPARFRDAAIQTKRAGMGATFHYEGGMQAKLPSKVEMACLVAWMSGLSEPRPAK